jgi:hypothetical protein
LAVDPEQAPAAAEALMSDVLPRLRSAPGFVACYWLEPADGQGFSMVLFETEQQAREAAPPATSQQEHGRPDRMNGPGIVPKPGRKEFGLCCISVTTTRTTGI